MTSLVFRRCMWRSEKCKTFFFFHFVSFLSFYQRTTRIGSEVFSNGQFEQITKRIEENICDDLKDGGENYQRARCLRRSRCGDYLYTVLLLFAQRAFSIQIEIPSIVSTNIQTFRRLPCCSSTLRWFNDSKRFFYLRIAPWSKWRRPFFIWTWIFRFA